MTDQQVDALVQVGALAVETLLDFLQRAPADDGERRAQDRAALPLVDQAQRLGDAMRARLGVPDDPAAPTPGLRSDQLAVHNPGVADHQKQPLPPPDNALGLSASPLGLSASRSRGSEPEGRNTEPEGNACDPARALAATLWGEARGEPFEGKIAIACVIRNRANSPGWWGRDVVSVCTAPAQFTCWHNGQAKRVRALALGLSKRPSCGSQPEGSAPRSGHTEPEGGESDPSFAQCLDIARDVLAGQYRDHAGGADHYHVASMDPPPSVGAQQEADRAHRRPPVLQARPGRPGMSVTRASLSTATETNMSHLGNLVRSREGGNPRAEAMTRRCASRKAAPGRRPPSTVALDCGECGTREKARAAFVVSRGVPVDQRQYPPR
jgi:hypothetical protein